ncbi:MAG TPA: glycosyltransferase, partial [Polyangiales bacterium]|nr:glycosyltransferase [Polyangiales bacterium]
RPRRLKREGHLWTLELPRSPLAISLERDLSFDPIYPRYIELIERTLHKFRPDLIHITGPSEVGILGTYLAWKLNLPLVASWHTNVHEYAARRMRWLSRRLGSGGPLVEQWAEDTSLNVATRFYKLAQVLYAPNPPLCDLLARMTGRPCHLMQRGVDTELFSPAKRTRAAEDGQPLLGYVGRLSVEKNVDLLPHVDKELRAIGWSPRWLIVGHGADEAMLRRELGEAAMAGVLRGEELAKAYANMDLLVFPSHTDTFGNVVLEALASALPAVVTPQGGPAHIVQHGVTGVIANDEDFAACIADLLSSPERLQSMRCAAREYALGCTWESVFERMIAAYPVVCRSAVIS